LDPVGRFAAISLTAALMSSCALGPDFDRPPPPDVKGYTEPGTPNRTVAANVAGGRAQRFESGRDIPGEWWTLFRSPGLRTLTARALRNNPDLKSAQAALRVARETSYAAQGAYFPQVDGGFSPTRQKDPAVAGPVDPTVGIQPPPTFNLFTGQVSVSYVPDVFGATRRAVESLDALTEAQYFQLEATYLTLTSNIVVAAVQEASIRGQIKATDQVIKIASDLLDLFRKQRALGQIADADVVTQEAALAQVQQQLPPLQRQLEQQRHLLIALTGGFPSERLVEKFELAMLHLPENLPLSIPSKLVEQRPDIRQAEANLHSAGALIGVAVANRLPNVTLTATAGSTAASIDQLFSPNTGWWTLGGDLAAPIFHGGTLLHQELAARAVYQQAAEQYKSTVITAFQNVADVLSALRTDADALQKAVAAEDAALRGLNISRERLRLGDINFLGLLVAQQLYAQALLSRVQAQAARFADTAALYQALGGGWWNRTDAPSPAMIAEIRSHD
jgi:NodT family efflux transporter outer membrane factor (OMF) lipoprotein